MMAQLQFPFPDLRELVDVSEEDAMEQLTMLGFPTEKTAEGELNVEVTPNRPDALSVEGIARALRSFRTGQPVIYPIGKSGIEMAVDPSVEAVRPYFGGAYVKGVRMSETALRSIMQLQEKLHETLGRKRRKVAIGIHDANTVTPPFRYFACGREDVAFVPLERTEKMTPLEILRRHDKGMAYAQLVSDKCPMIEDARHEILSFPPIINGERTKLTLSTTDVFIDATGTSPEAVLQAVNIVAAALAERGGKIEGIVINGAPYRVMEEKGWPIPVKESERLLGISLSRAQVESLLMKMGYRIDGERAFSQGFRVDVINEVDLIEDVAIAYGFNNFEPRLPPFVTYGQSAPETVFHEILVGMGFDEVMSWTLSNPRLEARAKLPEEKPVEIENPLTEDYTVFRRSILPNLLSILAESKNEKLPIRIYEAGPVASPQLHQRLCLATMHPRASFSEIKGIVLSLFETAGRNAQVKEEEFGPFLAGRCAAVYSEGKKVGYLGEVAPSVLSEFGLEQPACACEIAL